MEKKEYVDIPNYEGLYAITKDGEILAYPNAAHGDKRILSQRISAVGYKTVHLSKNGKSKTRTVHRLVALTFIPNPDNKPQVNHIDGNKLNCNIDNLEWCTPSENTLHAYKTGLQTPTIMTDAIRKKISIANSGVNSSCYGKLSSTAKKVTNGIVTFFSAKDASLYLGLNTAAVSIAIRKGYNAGGYSWKYL